MGTCTENMDVGDVILLLMSMTPMASYYVYILGSFHSWLYLWISILSWWCFVSVHPAAVSEHPRLFPILKTQCYSAQCHCVSYVPLSPWPAAFLCFRSQLRCCLFREVFPGYGIHLSMLLRKTKQNKKKIKPIIYVSKQP